MTISLELHKKFNYKHCNADVVKLVDTLVLEASALGVRVRVSPSAPKFKSNLLHTYLLVLILFYRISLKKLLLEKNKYSKNIPLSKSYLKAIRLACPFDLRA